MLHHITRWCSLRICPLPSQHKFTPFHLPTYLPNHLSHSPPPYLTHSTLLTSHTPLTFPRPSHSPHLFYSLLTITRLIRIFYMCTYVLLMYYNLYEWNPTPPFTPPCCKAMHRIYTGGHDTDALLLLHCLSIWPNLYSLQVWHLAQNVVSNQPAVDSCESNHHRMRVLNPASGYPV